MVHPRFLFSAAARAGLMALGVAASCGLAASAWAQSAPAADKKDAKAEAKPESKAEAEAAAAMERARRLASNPMRIILEASRVKRADTSGAVVPVASTAAATSAATASAAAPVAAASPQIEPRAVAPAPAPAPTPAPAPPPPAASVMASEVLQSRSVGSAAPDLEAAAVRSVAPVAPVAGALPALSALAPSNVRPTLINRIDPEPPQRLLADLDPNTLVSADLTIRSDGSVAAVQVLPSANGAVRQLARYVVAALSQWRFAPLPEQRTWRVDLLFRPDE